MFKEYKGIFKNLREMQDQLWKNSIANFPTAAFPVEMNDWQQKTFEGVNSLVEQAVRHSLQLQGEWLAQWKERASSGKLKPKLFSQLSAEAMNATQRWVDNQNRLWEQWLEVIKTTGEFDNLQDFEAWQQSMQDAMRQQTALLNDWSALTDFEKLSVKQATKLSDQIVRAMDKSLETQNRLWNHWLEELVAPAPGSPSAAAAGPKGKKTKSTTRRQTAAGTPPAPDGDLKKISGIGPGLEKQLNTHGISTVAQIAALTTGEIAQLEDQIAGLSGRIKRDRWVQQAKKLVS
jgi:predicted flap endonuclease-1-like 5' DNA nuclease